MFALCQSMYHFAHCLYPEMFEVKIMLQFLVLCYGLLGDGMDNSAAVFLNVKDGPSLLQISGYLNGLKSHDVMHCLDGYVAGQTRVDDMAGVMMRCRQAWHGTIASFIVGLNDVVQGGSSGWCRHTHQFSVSERMQVMWDYKWNDRWYNQKSLQGVNWLGPRVGCS